MNLIVVAAAGTGEIGAFYHLKDGEWEAMHLPKGTALQDSLRLRACAPESWKTFVPADIYIGSRDPPSGVPRGAWGSCLLLRTCAVDTSFAEVVRR